MEVEPGPGEVSRVGLRGGEPEKDVIVEKSRRKQEGIAGMDYVEMAGIGAGIVYAW
jgi:hypothetical protein